MPTKYKLPATTYREEKLVRVADEDDDRSRWLKDHNGYCISKEYANPLFLELRERLDKKGLYMGGWYPAINIRLRTMQRDYQHAADFQGYRGCAGFFTAYLQCVENVWRIACWGDDDDWHEKSRMSELQAKRTFERIKDHITIRSLYNKLGFSYRDKF